MDSSFDLDELYYTAIDLLEELIHTPSISREENDAADLIEQFFVHNNITSHRHGNNVWAIANGYDSTRPTLLLNSHIDTVKPVEGWTRHPFNAEVDEKLRLYGLGSNDAGASLVSLIVSFLYLSQRPQPYNLVMLASCEEEVS